VLGKRIRGEELYKKLFGNNERVVREKREMLVRVYELFKAKFPHLVKKETLYIMSVPNRVELLGKHTDYQGGETFLLTGPKNFFAVGALSDDDTSELINADTSFGNTVLRVGRGEPEILKEGVGAQFTRTVSKRLSFNLRDAGFGPLKEVKSVFAGDIPFGGGTSGSSAKLITDFFIFACPNGLLDDRKFLTLVLENGKAAGIKMNQKGVSDFSLALSMYLAHFENGLDFGSLKGDRGVGTFGGSEDHTAIVLGQKGKLLYCRYCPTEVLESVAAAGDIEIVTAYSGKVAEKTKTAMKEYNRLSGRASLCVEALNRMYSGSKRLLREFYGETGSHMRADRAFADLAGVGEDLAERAYQFFREEHIMEKAVASMKSRNIAEYGRLINESHELSKLYLKNIVEEVDFLKESANRLGAYGATGFGAGFGGSCYAVVDRSRADGFLGKWKQQYLKRFPQYDGKARFDRYPASSGAYWEAADG
jgi:galactokinase